GIRDRNVTGVQTCALPIYEPEHGAEQELEGAGRATLHRGGLARDRAPAARGAGALAARRPPGTRLPHRLLADRADEPVHLPVRQDRKSVVEGKSVDLAASG